MSFDFYEELDRMIDEEVPLKKRLADKKLTFAKAYKNSEELCSKFYETAKKYGLDCSGKIKYYNGLIELVENGNAEMLCSDEFTWLFAASAVDLGLLLDAERDDRTKKQDVYNYLDMTDTIAEVTDRIQSNRKNKKRLSSLSSANNDLTGTMKNTASDECREMLELLKEFEITKCDDSDITLFENMVAISDMVNSNEVLKSITPLLYWHAFVRSTKKLSKNKDYTFNLKSLCVAQKYKIKTDNGKNFNQYEKYVQLFIDLKEMFRETGNFDTELVNYGFLAASNLSDWFYENYEPTDDVPKSISGIIMEHSRCIIFFEDSSKKQEKIFKYSDNAAVIDFMVSNRKIYDEITKITESVPEYADRFMKDYEDDQKLTELISEVSQKLKCVIKKDDARMVSASIFTILTERCGIVMRERIAECAMRLSAL